MTLKKVTLLGILTLSSVVVLAACGSKNQASVQETTAATATQSQAKTSQETSESTSQATTSEQNNAYSPSISQERAVEIAISSAGLTPDQVKDVTAEADFDDMPYNYEIEFVKDTTEYSYTIDADSGNVLKYEQESIHD